MDNRSLDASYFHVPVSLGFTLSLVWYLFTSIPTLIANVSIHHMISVYLFSLFFQFDILFLFHLTLTLSQTRLRFFKTSIIKTAKTLYTFFCASSAPGYLLNLSPLPLHPQTYRINQSLTAPCSFVLPSPCPLLRFTSIHAPCLC